MVTKNFCAGIEVDLATRFHLFLLPWLSCLPSVIECVNELLAFKDEFNKVEGSLFNAESLGWEEITCCLDSLLGVIVEFSSANGIFSKSVLSKTNVL